MLSFSSADLLADYIVTQVDYPGNVDTMLWAINNNGQIVGISAIFNSPSDIGLSFLANINASLGPSIQEPGSTATAPSLGIDASGNVVGFAFGAGLFLRSPAGEFTQIPNPPGAGTQVPSSAISGNGSIVTSVGTNIYSWNGVSYSAPITVPGAFDLNGLLTVAVPGVDNSGNMVGHAAGNGFSFYRDQTGFFQTIYVPGAFQTVVYGMNNLGQAVGFYQDDTIFQGLIWNGGSNFVTLSYPGAQSTTWTGIDDAGELVGFYNDSQNVAHGLIAVSDPKPPVLISPGRNATDVVLTPTLSWNPVSGATSYDVYFGTSSAPPFVSNTSETSYQPGNLVSGACYFWRVAARNGSKSTSSAAWSFATPGCGDSSQPPRIPALLYPPTGAIVAAPTLSWDPVSEATSYDVYLGTSSTPLFYRNTTANAHATGLLQSGSVYFWRIVAKNTAGSTSSPTWSFTVPSSPYGGRAPVLVSPPSGATGISQPVTLTWTAESEAPYDVYFGLTNPPPFVANTTETSYGVKSLAPGATYFWRIVANGTASSETWSFTVVPGGPNKTFVATTGSDANDCSENSYCRTLARALAATNPGGEVVVVSSGGYGPATITQAVTITAIGVDASITALPGQHGLAVNTTGDVTITGLNLNGGGTGIDGIWVRAVGTLRLYNMQIQSFADNGIEFTGLGGALAVYDSKLSDSGHDGLLLQNGFAQAYVQNTAFDNNAFAGADSLVGNMTIVDSSAHYNQYGFYANGGEVTLQNDRSAFNSNGIAASGTGKLSFADCLISDNATAWSVVSGGTISASNPGTSLVTPGQATVGALSAPTVIQ